MLFNGAADAMRRQALVALAGHLKGRRLADQPLLDVACGTGRFLCMVKHNWPRLPVVGLDLSRPYLAKARRSLAPWSWARLVEGEAERLPFADASFAVVASTYLFHELPRQVRAAVAREMARVLRPGGLVVFVIRCSSATSPRSTACSTCSRPRTTSPTTPTMSAMTWPPCSPMPACGR